MLYRQVHAVGEVLTYLYTEKVAEKILLLNYYFRSFIKSQSVLTSFNAEY